MCRKMRSKNVCRAPIVQPADRELLFLHTNSFVSFLTACFRSASCARAWFCFVFVLICKMAPARVLVVHFGGMFWLVLHWWIPGQLPVCKLMPTTKVHRKGHIPVRLVWVQFPSCPSSQVYQQVLICNLLWRVNLSFGQIEQPAEPGARTNDWNCSNHREAWDLFCSLHCVKLVYTPPAGLANLEHTSSP